MMIFYTENYYNISLFILISAIYYIPKMILFLVIIIDYI